ncbi:hypothetical protein SEA_TREAT_84 [Streptomyces phage Treat]|nr:hypothetical protein SEA_TREAT_84 [Streptomyces phage Treat]
MRDYSNEVAKGIKVLDQQVPNWRQKIDVENLDLGSCSICVLGQVFGDYNDGIEKLNVDGYEHGFNTTGSYAELKDAWVEALGKTNTLIEKGDIYRDTYGYAVKVLQTTLVRVSDTETLSAYLVQSGRVKNGSFTGDLSQGKPLVSMLKRSDFEAGGSYSTKVPKLKLKAGMFITAGGKNYFVHSVNEVRELKDGAYAVSVSTVDLTDAKEMNTGMGVTFGRSISRSITGTF